MGKNKSTWMSTLLILVIGMWSCSSDDDETSVDYRLIGKWRFVEVLNRRAGIDQMQSHTIEIKESDIQQNYMKRTGGTITYSYDEGFNHTFQWNIIPKNDSTYHFYLPVFFINYVEVDTYEGEPYAYEIESVKLDKLKYETTLKLRLLGRPFNYDPNTETYVYKRIN